MKALTFEGIRDVHCATVPDPGLLAPGDVIVRVQVAGICGSDLHVFRGAETGLDDGTVLGHEFVGEVVEAGRGVQRFQPGDVVVSPFTTSCGECFYCRTGLTARCTRGQLFGWVEQGKGLHGAQAEYVRVPLADSTLVAVPEGAPAEEALFAGDILSTAFFGAETGGVGPGKVVAIVGCGPVGLMGVVSARELGAERIFAIDALPERLALAERYGATAILLKQTDPVEVVREATEGRGADVVLEAAGGPQAARLAFDLVRPGGAVSAVAVHTEERLAFSPVEAYDKNLTFHTGRSPARHYMERLLPFIQSRKYDLGALISHRLSLDEGPRGYDVFDQRLEGCTKVVLIPSVR